MATKKPVVQIRKPPSVPQNADTFVDAAQTPKPLDVQTPKPLDDHPELTDYQKELIAGPRKPLHSGWVEAMQTAGLITVQPRTPSVQAPKRSGAQTSDNAPKEIQAPLLAPEALKPSSAQASRRPVLRRQDGRELRKMTIYLSPDVAQQLAVSSAQTGMDMSEIVNSALESWLTG